MKEIRDLKIDLLTGNRNPIVDLFNQITDGVKIINCDVRESHGLEFIYFDPSSLEWIFYQDSKKEYFWCDYRRYWSFFQSNFNLKYQEIQAITKFLVEEALKREVSTPASSNSFFKDSVEEALKREVSTPYRNYLLRDNAVEEALKREVSTPMLPIQKKKSFVEEALKREVGKPVKAFNPLGHPVEEALKREVGKPKSR